MWHPKYGIVGPTISIEPHPVAEDTDEDSADEDEEGTFSNLNQNQLLAGSCASVLILGVRSDVVDVLPVWQ